MNLQLFKFLPRLSPKVSNIFQEMKRHWRDFTIDKILQFFVRGDYIQEMESRFLLWMAFKCSGHKTSLCSYFVGAARPWYDQIKLNWIQLYIDWSKHEGGSMVVPSTSNSMLRSCLLLSYKSYTIHWLLLVYILFLIYILDWEFVWFVST